jgi:hypothetical protein
MDGDIFQISFQGELIGCDTVLDAVAIKNADALLSSAGVPIYTRREIENLAKVLNKYGLTDAALHLSSETARLQAVELICRSGS